MTAPAGKQAVIDPDIPASIQRRKPVALTPIAAESTQGAATVEGLTLPGASGLSTVNPGLAKVNAQRKAGAKARKAKAAAMKAAPGEPLKGMTAAQIEEVRGRSYPKSPAMDPNLGDRTQVFVNWLWKTHPEDAAIRYAYRDIWPTD